MYCLPVQPLVQEVMKIVARCARLKSTRGALREAVEQATGKFSLNIEYLVSPSSCLISLVCQPRRRAPRSVLPSSKRSSTPCGRSSKTAERRRRTQRELAL